jgi:hypothetical protein
MGNLSPVENGRMQVFDQTGCGSLAFHQTNRMRRFSVFANRGALQALTCQWISVAAVLPVPCSDPGVCQ